MECTQGKCLQMCPQREISLREQQRHFHFFETLAFTSDSNNILDEKKSAIDPLAMVKEFSRSAAGKSLDPSSLRPANTLQQTMNYLVEKIASKDGVFPWKTIYCFMFDRIRAIRQDLVIQGITGKIAVEIFEKTCRFHILSGYKLCETPIDVFDSKINNDHTSECLKRLLGLYDEEIVSACNSRPEFESYYLLYNLGSFDAVSRAVTLPTEVNQNWLFQLALAISRAAIMKNFVKFFRLVKRLPYLACCALHKHFNQIRFDALAAINKAYYNRNASFPLLLLVQMLDFNDVQEAKDFCVHFDLEVTETAVKLTKGDLRITQPLKVRFSNTINEKSTFSASDMIGGKGAIAQTLLVSSLHISSSQRKGLSPSANTTDIKTLSSVPRVTSQPRPAWFGKARGRGRGWKLQLKH